MNNYLSALGLAIDIIGVLGLFFTKIKGAWSIPTPYFDRSFLGFGVANNEQEAIIQLQRDITRLIEEINIESKRLDKKSYKWLAMIVLGFILQIVPLTMSMLTVDSTNTQVKTETHHQNEYHIQEKSTEIENYCIKDSINTIKSQ